MYWFRSVGLYCNGLKVVGTFKLVRFENNIRILKLYG